MGVASLPMDASDEVERINYLEGRVAELEARGRSTKTWGARSRSVLRWLATTLPLLLFILVGLDRFSSATSLSLGIVLFVLWASAAVLWAAGEVFAGGNLRFGLTRLILVVAIVAVILGYWRAAVYEPYQAEQNCLASLKGLEGNIHRKTVGPGWLIGLFGKAPFQRVVQIQLAGPDADEHQIRRLRALTRLDCLFLNGHRFDDGVLDDLAALPAVSRIVLTDSLVTTSGVERFRRARPRVEIHRQTVADDPSRFRESH